MALATHSTLRRHPVKATVLVKDHGFRINRIGCGFLLHRFWMPGQWPAAQGRARLKQRNRETSREAFIQRRSVRLRMFDVSERPRSFRSATTENVREGMKQNRGGGEGGLSGERPLLPDLIPKDFSDFYRIPLLAFPPLLREERYERLLKQKKKKKKKKKNEGHPFLLNTSGGDPQGQITEKTIYIALFLFSPQHFFIPTQSTCHIQRDSCRTGAAHQLKSLAGVGGWGTGEGREAFWRRGLPLHPPSPLHCSKQNPLGHCCLWGLPGGLPVRHPRTGTYCT